MLAFGVTIPATVSQRPEIPDGLTNHSYFMIVRRHSGPATGWTVRGSNADGKIRFYPPVQTGPGDHPGSYTTGTGTFLGVKRPESGVNQPHLTLRLKKKQSCLPSRCHLSAHVKNAKKSVRDFVTRYKLKTGSMTISSTLRRPFRRYWQPPQWQNLACNSYFNTCPN
jgi:hypothetical protein